MKSILVVGAFGYKNNSINGQTIKTRNVSNALKRKYNVKIFDTQELQEHRFKIILLLLLLFKHKCVYYAGAQRSLKKFFPILFCLSKLRRSEIVYVAVGGWLYDFLLNEKNIYTTMVKNIRSVLVETKFLKEQLQGLGLNNVSWIPNFRLIPSYEFKQRLPDDALRVVFMARVTKEKGVFLIFDMLERYSISEGAFKKKLSVDFYGPVSESVKDQFQDLLDRYQAVVSYKGVLPPKEIYEALMQYDVLLLPTFYPGEGFPGTILDAYISGLPVIATRWKQIPEFVDENSTGFLIDYDADQLLDKVKLLANDEDLLAKMKVNARKKSKAYSAEVGLKILEKGMFF